MGKVLAAAPSILTSLTHAELKRASDLFSSHFFPDQFAKLYKMPYQIQLNLQDRAALSFAISFWEKKEMKDKIQECLCFCDKFEVMEAKKKWNLFIKEEIDKWNKDILPLRLEVELVHIVKKLGERIYYWYKYVQTENARQHEKEENAMDYTDQIYWTPFGTVDGVKIFESLRWKNPNLDISELNRNFLSYWSNLDPIATQCLKQHSLDIRIMEMLLRYSIRQSFYINVKFFWSKLTKEEKDRKILESARLSFQCYQPYVTDDLVHCSDEDIKIRDYKKEKYLEICIFFVSQMTEDHKRTFFNETIKSYRTSIDSIYEILKTVLSEWPWQKNFILILKDVLQYKSHEREKVVLKILDVITFKMIEDSKLGYSIKTSKYRSLLHETWLAIPRTIKENLSNQITEHSFICDLINLMDLHSLELILDDPTIAANRDLYIKSGYNSCKQFILEDQFEKLDQFIEKIFKSEDKKKCFSKLMNFWDDFITNDQFHLADKLLDWQTNTPEERQSIKSSLDHIKLDKILIHEKKFDLLEKFLNWQSETEEKRKKVKRFKK